MASHQLKMKELTRRTFLGSCYLEKGEQAKENKSATHLGLHRGLNDCLSVHLITLS